MSSTVSPELAKDSGLNYERILMHSERIKKALSENNSTFIPVQDACTIKNGGIISWQNLVDWLYSLAEDTGDRFFVKSHNHWATRNCVTMIPAAGAASRFLGEIQKFVLECEKKCPGLAEVFASGSEIPPKTKREEILATLKSLPVSEKFFTLPETLANQSFETVKTLWNQYKNTLNTFVEEGKTQESLCSGGCKNSSGAAIELKDFPESSMHIHWESLKPTSGSSCGGCPSAQKNLKPKKSQKGKGAPAPEVLEIYTAAKALVSLYSGVPKALVPTTSMGDTFLKLKLCEQISLFPCLGNVMVVPVGQVDDIQEKIKKEGKMLQREYTDIFELENTQFAPDWLCEYRIGNWQVLEQGKELSTIRFDLQGQPILENGKYSLVAAGHGELLHLFENISNTFPDATCIHVRNIDNVIGSDQEQVSEMAALSDCFRLLRDALEFARYEVENILENPTDSFRIMNQDLHAALDFICGISNTDVTSEIELECYGKNHEFLGISPSIFQRVLASIFHWEPLTSSASASESWMFIKDLLDRPLSVFGVVKKETGDVGGGPVYARLANEKTVKLCMEMPHASPEDSKTYFEAKGKCSHFNPVLAFFELKTHTYQFKNEKHMGKKVDFCRLFDDSFWLFSKKDYQGKAVCYHETVLYELIGNSMTANLVFLEVPRSLFVPHKTMFESLGKDRKHYGFSKTLGKPPSTLEKESCNK